MTSFYDHAFVLQANDYREAAGDAQARTRSDVVIRL